MSVTGPGPDVVGPSWPSMPEYDGMIIGSDGKRVGDLSTAEINSRLAALAIPGFAYANGRQINLAAYAKAAAPIHAAAGAEAVKAWHARAGI